MAKHGGLVANDARASYEKATKKNVISIDNALDYKYKDKKMIENK